MSAPSRLLRPRILAQALALALTVSTSLFNVVHADYMDDALNYIEGHDYKSAVISLKNALQENPTDVEARFMLGEIYLQLGFGAGALKEFEQSEKLGLDPETLIYAKGKAMLLQGNFREVIDQVPVRSDMPEILRAEVITLHGLAELGLNNVITAEGMFQEALSMRPGFSDALIGLARISIGDKRYNEAMTHLGEALASDPDCAECWILRGEIARSEKDFYRAKDDFSAALDIDSANFLAHLGIAASAIELEEFDVAKEHLIEVDKLRPNQPLATYLSAVVAFQDRDLETAEVKLAEALRLMPNHLPSLMLSGTISYATGQYSQAQIQLSRYVSERPDNLHARKLLSSAELKLGNPKRALSILRGALEMAPDDNQIRTLIGNAYMATGDYDKGSKYIEQAMEGNPESAALRTQLAVSKLAAGNKNAAITELKKAIEMQDGQSSKADVLLILTYLRNQDHESAIKASRELAEKLPDSAIPYNLLGAAFLGLKDRKEARNAFEQALVIDPKFSVAYLNLAKLDLMDKNLPAARAQLKRLLEFDPTNGNAMMEMARIASRQGEVNETQIWLERAWTENPQSRPVAIMLGQHYLAKNEIDKALNIAHELNKTHKNNIKVLSLLAQAQMAAGEKSSAVLSYKRIVELSPKNIAANMQLAGALLKVGDKSGALAKISELSKAFPKSIRIKAALAQMQIRNKRIKAALKTIKEIQRDNPQNPTGFRLQGDVLVIQKKLPEALKVYEKAFLVEPSSSLIAQIYNTRRKIEGASTSMAPLKEWLKDNPDSPDVRLLLAMAYKEIDDPFGAIREYREVLKYQPKHVVTLNNLALLLEEEHNPRAVEYAERAFNISPDSAAIADTYGWMLVNRGHAAEAVPILNRALKNARHIPEVRYHYAFALYQSGDFKQARRQLQRLVLLKQDFPGKADAKVLLQELRYAANSEQKNKE